MPFLELKLLVLKNITTFIKGDPIGYETFSQSIN